MSTDYDDNDNAYRAARRREAAAWVAQLTAKADQLEAATLDWLNGCISEGRSAGIRDLLRFMENSNKDVSPEEIIAMSAASGVTVDENHLDEFLYIDRLKRMTVSFATLGLCECLRKVVAMAVKKE